ncbi:hypothetical protein [Roseibium sp.]|uniref:hypothetical protein n=1 Tax=Roseibium sp. TaxID=1936156 RepID=UPI003D10EC5E
MTAIANRKRTPSKLRWLASCSGLFTLFLAVLFHSLAVARAGEAETFQNHVLAIGDCPPWNPQSVEICRHSIEKVVSAFAPRLEAGPDSLHMLINEGASAAALKRKATELANRLGPEDRLFIYANLPLGLEETTEPDTAPGYVLELWAEEKPATAKDAIGDGTWISVSAFAAMIHAIPAGKVVLILDANNSHAINLQLLENHSTDLKDRPEALVSSSGAGQSANYSADRTISLFAKHLALALGETEGNLMEVIQVAISGTRQAAIPICAALKEKNGQSDTGAADCNQVPEIYDPSEILDSFKLAPLPEQIQN